MKVKCTLISLKMPLGMSIATAVRVGNHMGAGLSTNAKTTAKIAQIVAGGFVEVYILHF